MKLIYIFSDGADGDHDAHEALASMNGNGSIRVFAHRDGIIDAKSLIHDEGLQVTRRPFVRPFVRPPHNDCPRMRARRRREERVPEISHESVTIVTKYRRRSRAMRV